MNPTQQLQLAQRAVEQSRAQGISMRMAQGQEVSEQDYNFVASKYPQMLEFAREAQRKVAVQRGYKVAALPSSNEEALARGSPSFMPPEAKQAYYDETKRFYLASEQAQTQEKQNTLLRNQELAARSESVKFYSGLGYPQYGGLYAPMDLSSVPAGYKVASINEVSASPLPSNYWTAKSGERLNTPTVLVTSLAPINQPSSTPSSSALESAKHEHDVYSDLYRSGKVGANQGTARMPTTAFDVANKENAILAGLTPEEKTQYETWIREEKLVKPALYQAGFLALAFAPLAAPYVAPYLSYAASSVVASAPIWVKTAAIGAVMGPVVAGGMKAIEGKGLITPEEIGVNVVLGAGFAVGAKATLDTVGFVGGPAAVTAVANPYTRALVFASMSGGAAYVATGDVKVAEGAALMGGFFSAGMDLFSLGVRKATPIVKTAVAEKTQSWFATSKMGERVGTKFYDAEYVEATQNKSYWGKSGTEQFGDRYRPSFAERTMMKLTNLYPVRPASGYDMLPTVETAPKVWMPSSSDTSISAKHAAGLGWDINTTAYGQSSEAAVKFEPLSEPSKPITEAIYAGIKPTEVPQKTPLIKDLYTEYVNHANSRITELIAQKNGLPVDIESKINAVLKERSTFLETQETLAPKPSKFKVGINDDFPSNVKFDYVIKQPEQSNLNLSDQTKISGRNIINVADASAKMTDMLNDIPNKFSYNDYKTIMSKGETLVQTKSPIVNPEQLTNIENMLKQTTPEPILPTSTYKTSEPNLSGIRLIPSAKENAVKDLVSEKMVSVQYGGISPNMLNIINQRTTPINVAAISQKINSTTNIWLKSTIKTPTPTTPTTPSTSIVSSPRIALTITPSITTTPSITITPTVTTTPTPTQPKLPTPTSTTTQPRTPNFPSVFDFRGGGGEATRSLLGGKGRWFKKKNPVPSAMDELRNWSLAGKQTKAKPRSRKVVIKIILPKNKGKRKRS